MQNVISFLKSAVLSCAFLSSQYSFADTPPPYCDCIWEGSFLQAYKKSDLVVAGKISRYKGNSIDFIIDEVLFETPKGKTFFPDIRIWTAYPNNCRPNIEIFKNHDEWVFALYRITDVPNYGFNPNTPSQSFGREQDYYLSACGTYWLERNENWLSGNLLKKQRWTYSDDEMNPILSNLLLQYIEGKINIEKIIEASKPQKDTIKQLMEKTKGFIWE